MSTSRLLTELEGHFAFDSCAVATLLSTQTTSVCRLTQSRKQNHFAPPPHPLAQAAQTTPPHLPTQSRKQLKPPPGIAIRQPDLKITCE